MSELTREEMKVIVEHLLETTFDADGLPAFVMIEENGKKLWKKRSELTPEDNARVAAYLASHAQPFKVTP